MTVSRLDVRFCLCNYVQLLGFICLQLSPELCNRLLSNHLGPCALNRVRNSFKFIRIKLERFDTQKNNCNYLVKNTVILL